MARTAECVAPEGNQDRDEWMTVIEMRDDVAPDELEKVRRNLVAVADKVEELIGEIDERA